MRLVGLGLPVTEIVTDDVDAGGALGYFTPALTHELLSCCVNYTETAIKVANPDEVAGIKDLITKAGGFPPASKPREKTTKARPSERSSPSRSPSGSSEGSPP